MCQSWGSALPFILYFWKHSLEGTVTWIQPTKQQNWRYLNYWQSYWAEKGTKMSRLIPSNWFLTFFVRHCCFRAPRNKKLRKFGCFFQFWALFTIFLASSTSVSMWSRWKPKNSSSLAYPRNFDTLFNPVASSIADWNSYIDLSSSVHRHQSNVLIEPSTAQKSCSRA